MSRVSYGARLTRSCYGVTTELWLHASCSPMVHTCRDPRLPVLFSTLLSDPCPAVVLVINGLGHRSPRTREKFGRFIRSDPTQEPWVGFARTTDRSAFISRAWLSHWYHHSVHFSSSSFSFEQAFRSVLLCKHCQGWQEPGLVVTV